MSNPMDKWIPGGKPDWRELKDDDWVKRKLKRDENFNPLPGHPDYKLTEDNQNEDATADN